MIAWDESGSGRPVVLVHGITEDRRSWDSVLPHLEPHFRCIRLDLRGHGLSGDADDYSAMAMAQDVATVVARAGLDEPPLLVGHSLGAVVVTASVASGQPARGIVNIDQSLRLGDFAAALHPLADVLRGPDFSEGLATIFDAFGVNRLPAQVASYLATQRAEARQEVVLGVWSTVLDSAPEDLTAAAEAILGAVRIPYLAIHGTDPGAHYADWLAQIPGAQVEVWGIGGHYPHLADPARFAARLAEFDASLP